MHETGTASLLAGSKVYVLKWADTEAAAELRQQLPLARTFTELHGNEKYCGGLLLAAAALLLTKFVHCRADEQQATDCLIGS